MIHNARHPCPVSYCTNARQRWAAVCQPCYRRLPSDIRAAFARARELRRVDMKYAAGVTARDWLNAHPPWAAASLGEPVAPP